MKFNISCADISLIVLLAGGVRVSIEGGDSWGMIVLLREVALVLHLSLHRHSPGTSLYGAAHPRSGS